MSDGKILRAVKLDASWDRAFLTNDLARGLDYADRGCVGRIRCTKSGIEAKVAGSCDYTVFLPADGNLEARATCTCPRFADGFLCKHIAAVCFETVAANKSATEEEGTESDRLRTLVEQVPERDLRSFLLEALYADERLERRFLRAFDVRSVAEEKKALRADLRQIVRTWSRQGFIDWQSSIPFEREYLETVDSYFGSAVDARDWARLSELCRTVCEFMGGIDIDDSNGFFTEAIEQAKDAWRAVLTCDDERAAAEQRSWLLKVAQGTIPGRKEKDGDWIVVEAAESLVGDAMAKDPASAKDVQELADQNIAEGLEAYEASAGPYRSGEYDICRWASVRFSTMEALGASVDEIAAFAEPLLAIGDMTLKLADCYRAHGRSADAVVLLERSSAKQEAGRQGGSHRAHDVRNRLLELYAELGDREKERKVVFDMIVEGAPWDAPSMHDLIERLRALCDSDNWETERNRLIACLRERVEREEEKGGKLNGWNLMLSSARSTLCELYASEGMLEELMAEVERRGFSAVVQYRELLEQCYAERLLAMLRSHVLNSLKGGVPDRSLYRRLASDMAQMGGVPGGADACEELAAEIRALYPRWPALHDELRRAGY